MTEYRIALPHPWEHIPVSGARMHARVDEIIDNAISRIPADVPPDQVAQTRIKMTEMMRRQLREAEEAGAVDYYLPGDLMHGVLISASFLVSTIVPDASAPEEVTGPVLARLLTADESRPATLGDTVWARSEEVFTRPSDEAVGEDVKVRKVEYITAVPSDQRRWVISTFTTVGDGDPDSDFTHLMVELFDAMMSTWRWGKPS